MIRNDGDASEERWVELRLATRMRGFADVPDETVRSVRVPTLVVMGDRDVATPEHTVSLFRLLPQARLLILPSGHGHYLGETSAGEVDGEYAPLTVRLIERFLDADQDE